MEDRWALAESVATLAALPAYASLKATAGTLVWSRKQDRGSGEASHSPIWAVHIAFASYAGHACVSVGSQRTRVSIITELL